MFSLQEGNERNNDSWKIRPKAVFWIINKLSNQLRPILYVFTHLNSFYGNISLLFVLSRNKEVFFFCRSLCLSLDILLNNASIVASGFLLCFLEGDIFDFLFLFSQFSPFRYFPGVSPFLTSICFSIHTTYRLPFCLYFPVLPRFFVQIFSFLVVLFFKYTET